VDAQELEKLKGTWKVVALETGGKPVPQDRVQRLNLTYVFDGSTLRVRRPDRPESSGPFILDSSANPKRLSFKIDLDTKCIYRIQSNSLTLCAMVDENPNAGYPAGFVSTASPTTDLITLERQ
jgi:uncharacterized protein (TIGR03067 family)